MSFTTIFQFDFSSAITAPPTSSQVRFDALDPVAATRLWSRLVTTDGIDVYVALMALGWGHELYVQDKNDHTRGYRFTVTGAAVDGGGYVEVPIAYRSGAGPLNNNQAIVLAILDAPASGGGGGGGAALITAAGAKLHLRRPDLADTDPDLVQKMAAAEAAILTYVNRSEAGRTASAGWNGTTVPADVQHAILLELSELYRFRGDDSADAAPAIDPGSELSPAITSLLRRWSDPVLA